MAERLPSMPGVVHLIKKNSSAAFQQICVHILTRKILNVQRMFGVPGIGAAANATDTHTVRYT